MMDENEIDLESLSEEEKDVIIQEKVIELGTSLTKMFDKLRDINNNLSIFDEAVSDNKDNE